MPLNVGGTADFVPYCKFDSKSGRIFTRVEDASGNYSDKEVRDLVAVFDFPQIQTGWLMFPQGSAPDFRPDPDLKTVPPRPPGVDGNGRPAYKRGLKMNVFSAKHLGGVREVQTNSAAVCGAISELYDTYLASPEQDRGMLPVVQVTGWVKADKNGNMRPEFKVIKWVARPAELPLVGAGDDDDFPAAPSVPPPQRRPAPEMAPAGGETEF